MEPTKTELDYKDYVIKDGKLVGAFEEMYQKVDNPWGQMSMQYILDSRRILAQAWCNKLKMQGTFNNVVELGCGFGNMTGMLALDGFNVTGVDISQTAIDKASEYNPNGKYVVGDVKDFNVVSSLNPDIIIMAELTWYMLDFLDDFIANLKSYAKYKQVYLIHLLTTYDDGVQKYGKDKFSNLDGILKYFDMNYLEYGYIQSGNSQGTFFVASL